MEDKIRGCSIYAYDSNANLTSDGTFGFIYDAEHRSQNLPLTAQDVSFGFSYSPASQMLTRTLSNNAYNWGTPAASLAYVPNGLNQYSSVSGTTFTYDLRGNLTSDGSRTFAYDLENRLTSVSGSAAMTLAYDPLGRLQQTVAGGVTTQFLYDGDRLVGEYNGSGALTQRYVHGAGVDEPLVWYQGAGTTARNWLDTAFAAVLMASFCRALRNENFHRNCWTRVGS